MSKLLGLNLEGISYSVIKLKKVSSNSIVQNLPFFSKLYPPCKHFISKVILSSGLYGFLFWVLQTNRGEEPISYLEQYYNQHFNIHVQFLILNTTCVLTVILQQKGVPNRWSHHLLHFDLQHVYCKSSKQGLKL